MHGILLRAIKAMHTLESRAINEIHEVMSRYAMIKHVIFAESLALS